MGILIKGDEMKKERFTNLIVIPFLFISLFYIGYKLGNYNVKPIVKTKTVKCIVPKVIYKNKKGIILNITYDTLRNDLKNHYGFLTDNQINTILKAIKQASVKYKINPLLIYSLISVESSFRFWIESPRRLVIGSDARKHYDNARGLMSIMPSIWLKELRANKVIKKTSQLYQISPNIMSGTYILSTLIKRYKGNAIKALESYFGKSNYAKIYQHKIRSKIGSLLEKQIF